jgi:peptide/nickel transport system substrate-binding protein/oligopeptide transport system substrate-binding protein
MGEQETGSRAISRAMENIMGLVQSVLESTSVLAAESSAIVKSMDVIKQGSRESNFGVADLNQMANTLSHESTLLKQELGRFTLPTPHRGGKVTTATVLWQRLTFDPAHTSASALGFISKAIHATLVRYGEGAELIPDVAERWEVLEQGLVYRFHLRRGMRFHNGRAVEARDVYETLLRLVLPEITSTGSWLLRSVKGAADVLDGRTRTLSGVVVVDQHTIDIHLNEPVAFFLSLMTMHECGIIPAEEARDPERYRLRGVGAGPFKVEEAVEGERVRLVRNRDYHIADIPLLDELTFRLDLRSFREVADAFLRGELDIAHGVPPVLVKELRNDPRYSPYLLTTVQLHTSYLGYDTSSAPFDRVEVRQAMNHAINRERINERIFGGASLIAKALLPPGLLGYEENMHGFDYDPERARSLLQKAGYGSGFTVGYRTWDSDEFNNSGMVPMMIEDLEAIGVHVNVTRHTATEATQPRAQRGHGLIYCANWYADFPDADNFFYIFFHSDATSIRGIYFYRSEIAEKIMQARRSNDVERRAAIYCGLNEMVIKEAPMVPLFHERLFVLHKPEVRGVRTSLVPPPVRYHDVWVEGEE